MDINRLRKWELQYEIRLRGLTPLTTVAENRTFLRQIIHRERSGESFPEVVTFDTGCELDEVRLTLDSLSEEIEFSSDPLADIRRLEVRFVHVRNRLQRIVTTDRNQENLKSELYELLSRLESLPELQNKQFEDTNKGNEHISLLDTPNLLLPEVVYSNNKTLGNFDKSLVNQNLIPLEADFDTKCSISKTSSPTAKRQIEDEFSRDRFLLQRFDNPPRLVGSSPASNFKRNDVQLIRPETHVPVYKWNITFDGSSNVLDFLERLEELRLSRGVDKEQLLRSAPELFTDSALIWYRSIRYSVCDWDNLVRQLKKTFLPCDYEFDLKEEISRRSQGAEEKLAIYVSVMENLFNRLSDKPSEAERVKLIRRNLLPACQRALAFHSINSISDLIQFGSKWEEANDRALRFQPPSQNQNQFLGPHLSYHRPTRDKKCHTSFHGVQVEDRSCSEAVANGGSGKVAGDLNSRALQCFNCGSQGHLYRECPRPMQKRCFRCQTPNCTVRTCRNCNQKQGNSLTRN